MIHKGLIDTLFLMVLVTTTCFVILLVLPSILWIWTKFSQGPCKIDITRISSAFYACPQAPVTLETVIKPEYIPLTSDHTLFTLLAANDTNTGLQIQELLALAASQGSSTITINGSSYDVSQIVKIKLDYLASNSNYNFIFESTPPIQIGNNGISPQFFSTTSVTLPDMTKVRAMLILP